ncbi:MAG: AAA family ATPase, partial [Mariprofundus sp.]
MSSLFARLKNGLTRSRESLSQLVPGGAVDALSEEEWIDIEDGLIMADCGGELAGSLVARARKRRGSSVEALKSSMLEMIPAAPAINMPDSGPFVLLVVGVNGTGKTTTIGKLATMFRQQGKSVLVGAGDTFRAAAVDQLAVWVDRAGADLVRQHEGADPAAVAFDTVQRGVARNYDVVIVDTAGRVQTDRGLMDELAKVRRVITKA